jgi:hypothetical protein
MVGLILFIAKLHYGGGLLVKFLLKDRECWKPEAGGWRLEAGGWR